MIDKIKFGLVGCGRVSGKHLEALKLIPETELVAVCDIVEDKAKKAAEKMNCKYYTNIDNLFESHPEINIMVVCTETEMHESIVKTSARAGKHVICEKPMGLRMIEAKRMVEVCKNKGVKLFIVKQNRYNLPIVKLKEALDAGRFGDLFFLNVTVRWSRGQDYYDQAEWHSKKNGGGGVLMNQLTHHLDMLYYLGGEVESVHCIKKTFAHNIEVEDGVVAILKFKNGALGTIEGSTCAFPKDIEGSISVLGRKGSVKIGGFAMNKIDFWQFENSNEEDKKMQEIITNPPNVYGFGHLDLLKDVIYFLKNGKKSFLEGDKVIDSFRIIMAMQKSAKENREVFISEINDDDEDFYT